MTSGAGSEPPWRVGETRTITGGRIVPCERGYHGSPTLWDALQYAPGAVACRVEMLDDVIPHGNPVDKYAARSRTLLHAVNIERELRLFAADCAERVLPIFEAARPDDDRPRKAIEAARRFANGEIDAAAGAAAGAAWAAAGAAEGAAWAAAGAAARTAGAAAGAAWAAEGAAWAAEGAAWAAAGAARTAEQAWQREHFAATVAVLVERITR